MDNQEIIEVRTYFGVKIQNRRIEENTTILCIFWKG